MVEVMLDATITATMTGNLVPSNPDKPGLQDWVNGAAAGPRRL